MRKTYTIGAPSVFVNKNGLCRFPEFRDQGIGGSNPLSPTNNLSSTFSEASNNFNLGFTDPFFPGLDRGNADFDIRHRFVMSAVWEVPMFKNTRGALGQVLGRWSFA